MRAKQKRIIWVSLGILVGIIIIVIIALSVQSKPNYISKKTDRPMWGNPNAAIKIVEYSDFSCPACQMAEQMTKMLKDRWSDKISFSYRHFPLIGVQGHELSFPAAEAAECAYDQDQFWTYHDLLFANQPNFTPEALLRYAKQLNLNEVDFTACVQSRVKADVVKSDQADGFAKNIDATPTFFLNGQKVDNWQLLPDQIANLLGDKSPLK